MHGTWWARLLNNIAGVLAPQIPTPTNSYESIYSTDVGSGGTSSVVFSSIPSTFKHLQVRAIVRSTNTGTDANTRLRFNGDTGSNYRFHYLTGSGSGTPTSGDSGAASFAYAGLASGASSTAGVMGVQVIDILDYASTSKYKTVRSLNGVDNNGSGFIELDSSLWMSTSAINSLTLFFTTGNLAQYSSIALYGIKG